MKEEIIPDIICSVFAGPKAKEPIYSVLNEFLPQYKKLDPDYAIPPDDDEYEFQSEEEMINYFIDNSNVDQTFYWNQSEDNPDRIMVGANITNDDMLVITLTIDSPKYL